MPQVNKWKTIGVTAALTCYNASDSIERAVTSIFEQDCRPDELIVVDDCSVDGCLELLMEASANADIPTRIFQNDRNRGVGYCRQFILDLAHYNTVVFFDDDDVSDPERVSAHCQDLNDAESIYESRLIVSLVARRQISIANDSEVIIQSLGSNWRTLSSQELESIDYLNVILRGVLCPSGHGQTAACAMAIRIPQVYPKMNFFGNLRRSEDTFFTCNLNQFGGIIIATDRVLLTQYITTGREKNITQELLSLRQLLNILGATGRLSVQEINFFRVLYFIKLVPKMSFRKKFRLLFSLIFSRFFYIYLFNYLQRRWMI